MAENTSSAKHITQLDFDISSIKNQLSQVEKMLDETVQNIQKSSTFGINFDGVEKEIEKIQKVFKGTVNDLSAESFAGDLGIDKTYDDLKKVDEEITELIRKYGDLVKVSRTYDASGDLNQAVVTYDDKLGNKVIAQYELEERAIGKVINKKQEYEQVWTNTNTKIINDANVLNSKLEQQEKLLQSLITKQKSQLTEATSYGASKENNKIIEEANANLKELERLQEQVSKGQILSSDQAKDVENYKNKISSLNQEMKTVNATSNNFLKTITDKARWLSAFYLITMIEDGFRATVEAITEAEDAVIELQRVLNEDVSDSAIQQELYNIAQLYGRSFEEVSETAVKFAQTGATWNETLKLTEATMLAVNTAELEVESATTGLIAVIAQFNLEASDMIDVIDKINITADNFAVTSEKIVAALQRTGSAAVNTGLSLDETIALITQLSIATGRSGESIGTALNSLLVYSQRSSSMELFASLSSEMEALVQQFNAGRASITDIWQQLSIELQDRTKQISLSQLLSQDSEFEQWASSLELEASDITSEIQDIYGIAGTHRQNYFISLVKDMGNYTDALDQMTDAEGHSLRENEQTMESLTRQYQTLIENVSLLAVEFGEAGFLEFLKTLISIGDGAANLVRDFGGLRTVLIALLTIIIQINQQKVTNIFTGLLQVIPNAITGIKTFGTNLAFVSKELAKGKQSQLSFGNAVEMVFGSVGNAVSLGIGVAVTALSLYNQKQEEARQATIESISTFQSQIDELAELKKQYDETASSIEDEAERNAALTSLKDELIKKYNLEEEALVNVNNEREEYNNLINQELSSEYSKWWADNREEIDNARKALEDTNNVMVTMDARDNPLSNYDFEKEAELVEKYNLKLVELDNLGNGLGQDWGDYLGFGVNAESDIEAYEKLGEIITDITSSNEEMDDTTALILSRLQDTYDNLKKEMDSYLTIVEEADRIQIDYYKNILGFQEEQIASITNVSEKSQLYADALAKIQGDADLTSVSIQELTKWLDEIFNASSPESVTVDFEAITYDAELAAEKISALSSQLDNAQSSFSSINEVMYAYNTTGQLDIDMMQQLMSLSGEYAAMLNFEGGQLSYVDSVTGQVIGSKQELVKQYIAEQTAAQLASLAESFLTNEGYKAQAATVALSSSLAQAQYDAFSTANGLNAATNAAVQYANALTGWDSSWNADYTRMANQIVSNSQNMYDQIGQMASSPSTWGSDGIQQASQAAQEANDAQIEALEKQKEAIKDRYNAEIDALKKVQEETERLREVQDYESDIASASARSGAEYREEQSTLEEELKRQQEDWAIEDTIAKLEELRDKEVAIIDEQIEILRDKASSFSSGLVSGATAANAQVVGSYANDVVEANAEVTEEALNNYKEGYVDPLTELMVETGQMIATENLKAYEEYFFIPFQAGVEEMFQWLSYQAELNAKQMYSIYDKNFITPMLQAYALLNNPILTGNYTPFGTTTNNNNSTTNNSNLYFNNGNTQTPPTSLSRFYNIP